MNAEIQTARACGKWYWCTKEPAEPLHGPFDTITQALADADRKYLRPALRLIP
jgi:hypothetical protein